MIYDFGTLCRIPNTSEYMFVGPSARIMHRVDGYLLFPLSMYQEAMKDRWSFYHDDKVRRQGRWANEEATKEAVEAANAVTTLKTPFGDVNAFLVFDGSDIKLRVEHNNNILAEIYAGEDGIKMGEQR